MDTAGKMLPGKNPTIACYGYETQRQNERLKGAYWSSVRKPERAITSRQPSSRHQVFYCSGHLNVCFIVCFLACKIPDLTWAALSPAQ
jgi:hypothetical protein